MKSLLPVLCLLFGLCGLTVSSVPCAQGAMTLYLSCRPVCEKFDAWLECIEGTVDKLPGDCPAYTKAQYEVKVERLIKRIETDCSKPRAKRATARVHRHHKHTRSHRRARIYRRYGRYGRYGRYSYGRYGPSRRYSGGIRWSPPSGRR